MFSLLKIWVIIVDVGRAETGVNCEMKSENWLIACNSEFNTPILPEARFGGSIAKTPSVPMS